MGDTLLHLMLHPASQTVCFFPTSHPADMPTGGGWVVVVVVVDFTGVV